ncbi:MAG: hypothetical protein Q4B22_01520 [Eubacteriales bacterium]|nr:hypothetical protein [Eubacteriales bacterium]
MGFHTRKRRHGSCLSVLLHFMLTIIIILLVAAGALYLWKDKLKHIAADFVVDKTVDSLVDQITADHPEVQEIVTTLSPEDKESLTEIVENNLSPDTLTDLGTYIQNEDVDGAIQYAQENLSEEDFNRLYSIYSAYAE